MPERTAWELEQLKKRDEERDADMKDFEGRIRALESFKDTTVEKLISIFNMLEELREGDKWIKRMFSTSLITGIIGAVISFIVWAIQN